MEGDEIIHQILNLNLPFSNCSVAQIETEFLGENKHFMKNIAVVNSLKTWPNILIQSQQVIILATIMT